MFLKPNSTALAIAETPALCTIEIFPYCQSRVIQ